MHEDKHHWCDNAKACVIELEYESVESNLHELELPKFQKFATFNFSMDFL